MDPLSDVLFLLKPRSYLTARFNAGGNWAIQFDDQVGRIKCYAVVSGACLLSVKGVGKAVRVEAGDCFVLPTGRSFRLGSDLDIEPMVATEVFEHTPPGGSVVHNGGGGVFLIGNRFEVDGRLAEGLLGTLPPIVHLRATSDQAALCWSIERMMEEVREKRPGASLVAHHLAHLMLVQALRSYLSERPDRGVGWFFALGDPRLNAAISAMHDNPAHRWTLDALAGRAGMSRSVFAQQFREKVGETAIMYLTRWRMMVASEYLTTTESPLAQIALSLGYENENAFNTAFKRVMGCSPRRYALLSSLKPVRPETLSASQNGSAEQRAGFGMPPMRAG